MIVKDYKIKTYPSNFIIRLSGENDYGYYRIDIDGLEIENEADAKLNASADIDRIEAEGYKFENKDVKKNLKEDLEFLYNLYLKK